jgi:hypothetical protein
MKISDVKNAITMMQEYVRLTEIIARIQKGETIEILLGDDGLELGHIDGVNEGIINRITDARNIYRSKLQFSYNIPIEINDEPELPFPITSPTPITGPADQSWRLGANPVYDKPIPCVCTTGLEINGCKANCNVVSKYNAIKEP